MSFSASLKSASISRTVQEIVVRLLPEGGTIFDPTCGEEMYQLQNLRKREHDMQLDNWLQRKKQKKAPQLYKIITSDLKPTGDLIASVQYLPLRDNSADAVIYDPPFTPNFREDKRGANYGIDIDRTPEQTFQFYSLEIYKELARVSRKYVIVRGMDFYFPPETEIFYPFWRFALKNAAKAGLEDYAIYSNKNVHGKLSIYRWRLKHLPRPIISHSYIAVFKKKEAAA